MSIVRSFSFVVATAVSFWNLFSNNSLSLKYFSSVLYAACLSLMFSDSRKLIFSYNAFIADAIALEVEGSRVQSRDILAAGVGDLPGDLIGDCFDWILIGSGDGELPMSKCSSYSVFIFRA